MLRLVRRAVPYLLLGVLTLLVAGAVGIGLRDQPNANDGTATRDVAAASQIIGAPTTTTTLPSGAVVSSTRVAPCRASDVRFITPNPAAAAGTVIGYLGIVNLGGVRCSLQGFPKVLGLNSAGVPVAQAHDNQCGYCWDTPYYSPPVVVLSAGEASHVPVFGSDYDDYPGHCADYPTLSVTLPGDDVATVVSMGLSACGGLFTVGYIRPGQLRGGGPLYPHGTHVAPCRAADLQFLPVNTQEVPGGAVIADLEMENVGPMPCSLNGYPKVLGLNSSGVSVAQALERDSMGPYESDIYYSKPPNLVLAFGESAHATLFGNDHNFSPADCRVYPAISVTLPDAHVAKVISMNKYSAGFSSCRGRFHVNFIRPT